MSSSRTASKKKGAKKRAKKPVPMRKSPLAASTVAVVESSAKAAREAKKSKVNTLKRRGYFAGPEIVDVNRQHFEPAELMAFFKAIPRHSFWYPYFFLQYFYGCRLSEPALILVEDVSFKKKQIIIKRLKKAQEAEGYRETVYAADQRVLSMVQSVLDWKEKKHYEENPFLFASNRKRESDDVGAERLSQLRNLDGWQAVSRFTAHRMFQRIARSIKMPENLCHSHVLRHTRAVIMMAAGASVDQVQYTLGHSSLKMTQRYVSIAENLKGKLPAELETMGLGL